MRQFIKLGIAAGCIAGVLGACAVKPSGPINQLAGAGVGGAANATSSDGLLSTVGTLSGGTLTGGLGGSTFSDGIATSGTGAGGTPECGGVTSKAEVIPLDIYLMLDSSASMDDQTGANATGPTKWTAITGALSTFFTDTASAGIGVGFQHFPVLGAGVPETCTANAQCPGGSGPCFLRACGGIADLVPCQVNSDCLPYGSPTCVTIGQCGDALCGPPNGALCQGTNIPCGPLQAPSFCVNGDSCVAADYAAPAVEIGALNGAATALNGAIALIAPAGRTPTGPALQGAVDHAAQWATAHPTHEVVLLFATDGLPTECTPEDIPGIAAIAGAGLSGTPSVKTFVIGVFAPADLQTGAQANLDQIAMSGGTTSAFIVDVSQNDVEQTFLAALTSIRGTKLACQYQVPVQGDAGALDYSKVNVEYTPGGTSSPATIGYVGTMAGCDPTKGGWYYDVDPQTGSVPTKIIMCQATCATFGNDTGGEVDIQVGCQTVVQPPPN
jgi:hypothetical protein